MPSSAGEARGRQLVRSRSGGRCEVCGERRAESWSHRKARGQGGSWSPANGLDACGGGTTGCHGRIEREPEWARLLGYRVPSHEDPASVWTLIFGPLGRGWYLLDDDGCVARDWQREIPTLLTTSGEDEGGA